MSVFDQTFHGTSSCFGFDERVSSTHSENFHEDGNRLASADEQKKQAIDTALSQAMANLTFEERQEQLHVLHGVDEKIAEESAFIDGALQELDGWLQKTKAGTTYEQAERADPNYVSSKAFRVMFLRGNRYDAKAAADQMIRFFNVKSEIFGMEKLVKDITMNDLDEDDQNCLRNGFMQVIGRDASNREVVCEPASLRNFKSLRNELRSRYYIIMKMLESEETQLRGAVGIPYAVGEFRDKGDKGGHLATVRLFLALPMFYASIHLCSDSVASYAVFSVVITAMPPKLRARFQIHLGSHMEIRYKLASYGIRGGILPLTPDTHSIKLEKHLEWCETCFTKESQQAPHLSVASRLVAVQPIPNDVLHADGKTSNNPGNIRLRSLVRENQEAYQNGSTKEKRQLVDNMITQIQRSGGRFLKQAKQIQPAWEEIPLTEAQNKIMQMFRNHKRRNKPSQGEQRVGTPILDEPLSIDVLCGRANKNGGTLLLKKLIKDRTEEYEALDRGKKAVVVDTIHHKMKEEGSRFLLPDSDGWVELSDEAARGRISRAFRNNRRYASNK